MERRTLFRLKVGVSQGNVTGVVYTYDYLEDGVSPVDKSELPILLPDEINLNFKEPLSQSSNRENTVQKSTGKKAIRETDTLDTFVDSSCIF